MADVFDSHARISPLFLLIFKVETIGDCYGTSWNTSSNSIVVLSIHLIVPYIWNPTVAATGLPNDQPDHAVRMVKFARDCRLAMSETVYGLVDRLGADTRDLEMRVGLNSGPTTAGVLRGERGRFQLFGDTLNTASRMESNGVRGKIHVSEATYQALCAQGKRHWCVPRPDKIVAKGKGEMQTYFVEFSAGKTTVKSSVAGDDLKEEEDDDNNDDDQEVDEMAERLQHRLSKHSAGARDSTEEEEEEKEQV